MKPREWVALLVIPFELLLGEVLPVITGHKMTNVDTVLVVCLQIILAIVVIHLFRDLLGKQWQGFRTHKWRNILIALVSALVLQLVLTVLRHALGALAIEAGANMKTSGLLIMTLSIFPVLLAPFIEEVIFRHILFYKFKDRGAVKWVMLIVSSILFGLAHINNFGGHIIATIPYMVVGAIFGLIYWRTKNIWNNIISHLFFNSSVLFGVLALWVAHLLGN
jgi:membrane protease YdiL (CAAX protease family)